MKAHYLTAVLLAVAAAAAVTLPNEQKTQNTGAASYSAALEQGLRPSPVYAAVTGDCTLYGDKELKRAVGTLKTGDIAEILADRTRLVYLVKSNDKSGWIRSEYLSIPPDPPTVREQLGKKQLENLVNTVGCKSKSGYFVWVDIARQYTYVFKYDEEGTLRLVKSIICATGKNESPTTRGSFVISDKGEGFYNERLGSGARYWVRFNGSYLFHSIALNRDGSVKDDTLGVRRSDGCVRMSMEDIKWFYNTVPRGTAVVVN